MMSFTHSVFSLTLTSLALGTANPLALGIATIASLLPDIDTSRSLMGKLCFPISKTIEKHFPHRTLTHSFLATGLLTIATYPLVIWLDPLYWQALILGFFFGWFADAFTKSGVAAFYPSKARLVIPGNPKARLATGSGAEWFVLFLLAAIAVISINLNSTGGIIRGFNQALGIPSGAIETINEDASRYLLYASIKGRNSITQEPIAATYEVIQTLSMNDILVTDQTGQYYRVGSTQESQIVASQMKVRRGKPIVVKAANLKLDDDDLGSVMARLPQERTYLSGTLTIPDAEDLNLPTHLDRFDPITLQPGEIAFARLTSAPPREVNKLLGDYYASGNLIVRTVESY